MQRFNQLAPAAYAEATRHHNELAALSQHGDARPRGDRCLEPVVISRRPTRARH
jgi:hypothetical protein